MLYFLIVYGCQKLKGTNTSSEKESSGISNNHSCLVNIILHIHAMLCLVTQLCLTLCDPMDYSLPGPSVNGDSPGKSTGVGCCALLQGIFPIQGLNPAVPHYKWILYHLSHQGSPWMLEWVAYPHPGMELGSPALQVDSLPAELPGKPPETYVYVNKCEFPIF